MTKKTKRIFIKSIALTAIIAFGLIFCGCKDDNDDIKTSYFNQGSISTKSTLWITQKGNTDEDAKDIINGVSGAAKYKAIGTVTNSLNETITDNDPVTVDVNGELSKIGASAVENLGNDFASSLLSIGNRTPQLTSDGDVDTVVSTGTGVVMVNNSYDIVTIDPDVTGTVVFTESQGTIDNKSKPVNLILSERAEIYKGSVDKLGVTDGGSIGETNPKNKPTTYTGKNTKASAWDTGSTAVKKAQGQTNQEQTNQEQTNQEQTNQEQTNQGQTNQEQTNQEQTNQGQTNQGQTNQKEPLIEISLISGGVTIHTEKVSISSSKGDLDMSGDLDMIGELGKDTSIQIKTEKSVTVSSGIAVTKTDCKEEYVIYVYAFESKSERTKTNAGFTFADDAGSSRSFNLNIIWPSNTAGMEMISGKIDEEVYKLEAGVDGVWRATVPAGTKSIPLTAQGDDEWATVTCGDQSATGDGTKLPTLAYSLDLGDGENSCEFKVTSEDKKITNTYQVVITRENLNTILPSNTAGMKTISGIIDEEVYELEAGEDGVWRATVPAGTESIPLTAQGVDEWATVTCGDQSATGDGTKLPTLDYSLNLENGKGQCEFKVTSEDGKVTKTYPVVITIAEESEPDPEEPAPVPEPEPEPEPELEPAAERTMLSLEQDSEEPAEQEKEQGSAEQVKESVEQEEEAADIKKEPIEQKEEPAEPKKEPVEQKEEPTEPKEEPVEQKEEPTEPKEEPVEEEKKSEVQKVPDMILLSEEEQVESIE
ncbi:MAG: cadherin-like beta sandwich domain-containing protein [Hespellia sp.]|nr:cadherin-like beta sandwich domain-containing protein [Hespellia sp.]